MKFKFCLSNERTKIKICFKASEFPEFFALYLGNTHPAHL